jgi:hypothetical protein
MSDCLWSLNCSIHSACLTCGTLVKSSITVSNTQKNVLQSRSIGSDGIAWRGGFPAGDIV